MASPLPPDPYLALGVPKDATQAAIKTAHRKLVLKYHPDKITDPDAKQAASDQFHKIQTSYEILIDQDRRERYDAQVRLAELRREKLERQGNGRPRAPERRPSQSGYRSSQENVPRSPYASWDAERGPPPQTEERKPAYAKEPYDSPPRASARKEPEYERSSRRSANDAPKQKSRTSTRSAKESEREQRREKTRRFERDTKRERDQKYRTVVDDGSESNSEYERVPRRTRDEDDAAGASRRARDAYYEQDSKPAPPTSQPQPEHDERTRKYHAARADAWNYIRSSHKAKPESERRQSPPARPCPITETVEYLTRREARPTAAPRKAADRPRTSGRDDTTSRRSSRDRERHSSDERGEPRRIPTLNQAASSPASIYIPSDKPRAQSVQVDSDAPEMPRPRRSETMPYDTQFRTENVVPSKGHSPRTADYFEGISTSASPVDYTTQPTTHSKLYRYPRHHTADTDARTDGHRAAANDGFRTEVREPAGGNPRPSFTRRVTRSPSPMKEHRELREGREARESRDKLRSASTRYPTSAAAPPLTPRTMSYVYSSQGQGVEARPQSGRGSSFQEPRLYGEIDRSNTDPTRPSYTSRGVAEDSGRYRSTLRAEDIRSQTGHGYSRRVGNERPSTSRASSGFPAYTSVRAA